MAKPANNFRLTPRAAFSRYTELNFSNLYLYHTYAGPNPTQATIITGNPSTGLGTTAVNNWQIYDGLGPEAKVVARAQGLHILAGKWRCGFSIVFENERFNGSTLEVDGVIVEEGEWAIVGGTGEFKMATGVIYKKVHQSNSNGNIIELTVHGFCPVLLKPYKAGPWGTDTAGEPYDIKGTPLRLVESITVSHGDIVDAIEFSYIDQDGEKHKEKMGGNSGSATTFTLRPSEYVIEVSGSIGSWQNVEAAIGTIKFVTNMASYGPYGLGTNATGSYSARAEDGYNIAGFFGRSGRFVNKLGFYMQPL
ncbi:hypothetical protein BAE44_0022881 [Dichanthelium oligosanthes]|uniref:Dirigent protein n=1 Tax=Dichanthelium oligosanthes TaxID=888268 RepID=A0A1E5UTB7_9POAL|nr:hypothetical protein BAE44_0022881 [Dichanthelium oligosanthes]